MEKWPFQVGLKEYCTEMQKKFDPARAYCMALTDRNTICLYPSAAGTIGVCGRSDTSCTAEKLKTGRGIIELIAMMKTSGGNCSFSACMEAYCTEAKDRAARTERLKVEPVIQVEGVVGVGPSHVGNRGTIRPTLSLAWHQQQPLDAPRDVRQLQMQAWERQLRWREQLKKMKIPQGVAEAGVAIKRSADLEAKNTMLEHRVEDLSSQLRELTLHYSTAQSQLQDMATKHEASHERAAIKIQTLEQLTAKLHEQVENQGKLVADNAGNITESVDQFQKFTSQFL